MTESKAPPESESPGPSLSAIERCLGIALLLMAIDHVRAFAGIPAGGSTGPRFFTWWVTHFSVPVLVFLTGTSVFLDRQRHDGSARHLFIRGLWLVVLDLSVIRFAWTFNTEFLKYELAGVLWVIGWSMMIMSVLVRLPWRILALIGVAIMVGHNLLDGSVATITRDLGNGIGGALWKFLYAGFLAGPIRLTGRGPNLFILYSLVPWIGVMAAGYAFGQIFTVTAESRRRTCLTIGLGATAAFVVLRAFRLYGDPAPWQAAAQPGGPALAAVFSFLDASRYPASLHFLLMTLGPTIALIPFLERAGGRVARWASVFRRVPLFFYVTHLPLIHLVALLVSKLRMGTIVPWLFENHPLDGGRPPAGYAWSLGLVYLVWLGIIGVLFVLCRWFATPRGRPKVTRIAYL